MDSKQAFTDFIQQFPKDIQVKLNQLVDIIEAWARGDPRNVVA